MSSNDLVASFDLEDLMEEFDAASDVAQWPAFVVTEHPKSVIIRADLGTDFSENDVFVDVVDNYVCISASKDVKSFQKEWLFPFDIDFERGAVTMKDHKIELKIPKK